MAELIEPTPHSPVESVADILHGVTVSDPYRWLEDQESCKTRQWIATQTQFARSYLDSIPGRARIRERVRELLDVETYDSFLRAGNRYFFRKRAPGSEQPCIFLREGLEGDDLLLIDPADRGTGEYTAVKPLQISHDARLLLYEVKQGGERTGTFEIFDVESQVCLPDHLPRGYLRGFTFAPDGNSFFYVHQAISPKDSRFHAAYQHFLGSPSEEDREVFRAEGGRNVRLTLLSDRTRILFVVHRFLQNKISDFYLKRFDDEDAPAAILLGIDYMLAPDFLNGRIFAVTNRDAPNRRIVEIRLDEGGNHEWIEIVPECDMVIQDWVIAGSYIFVCYSKGVAYQIHSFDSSGRRLGEVPTNPDETVRLVRGAADADGVLLETESFLKPITVSRYSASDNQFATLVRRRIPFEPSNYTHLQSQFNSDDGTTIPIFLVGRTDVLDNKENPTILTAYGGFGNLMTPQFSLLVAFLMERGCLFALPNIRGGSEMGIAWHEAAKRRNRMTAIDDFVSAAEWLIVNNRTARDKLAIFGGSNSGLLVGAALVRRPDLFRAAICIAPLLDMLRYHLFDSALLWKDEFGTADNLEDFSALSNYSPYHLVRKGVAYPAVMLVSGDADQNCNPMHARKMTARLQEANSSGLPIILDYNSQRGHSAVLPMSTRIEALTDRLAFLCSQLQLSQSDGDC